MDDSFIDWLIDWLMDGEKVRSHFQLFKEKCTNEEMRIGKYNHLSSEWPMKSQVFHTVWCDIFGEAAGEIWKRPLLGVKGSTYRCPAQKYNDHYDNPNPASTRTLYLSRGG